MVQGGPHHTQHFDLRLLTSHGKPGLASFFVGVERRPWRGFCSQLGPDLGLQLGMVLAETVSKSKQGTREDPMFLEVHIHE